tara:strand:+ start:7002 stop:7901 length:900 start_codon:yes stop_codon:yes gene_type:complete
MKNKKNQYLISVIIPCFNSGNTLKRSIESIKSQTLQSIEIIVVNDGSDDKKTLKVISSLKDVKIINQKNNGLPSARNIGASNSKGEFLLFLDADDWIENDALELMYKHLINHKDYAYVFPDIFLEGKVRKIISKEYNFFEQLFLNQLPYCFLISKKTWNKTGGYDEEMILGYEDWEFNIRIGSRKMYGKKLALPLFHYSVNQSGMLISKSSKLHSSIWKYIKNKHFKLYKLKSIIQIWWEWRTKSSSYPLIIFFPWYLFLMYLPDSHSSNIFIFFRNIKWLFVRRKIFKLFKSFKRILS